MHTLSSVAREESMSFQVVRHEHPDIFVLNRQTYETYRFTVGDNVMLPIDGAPSDLSEARRTAIEFLAHSDLLPKLPSFIRRVCSGYAPDRGVLRTRLV